MDLHLGERDSVIIMIIIHNLDLVTYQLLHTETIRLTEKVCKRVSASEEFPEDVVWVTECERFVEMISVVEMSP